MTSPTSMKIPQHPPSFAGLLEQFGDAGWFSNIMERITEPERTKYLHWHKLRFYDPPEGLTKEQWWFALELIRRASSRTLPLRDRFGVPFTYHLADPISELLHRTDTETRG